ncbi:placenta-specific gene 8 protein-like isoform X1 [Corvus hawaiiensis]|uniref:placenta-specific gene 8 protein-like isoform X1 n=1 Tax=Corvus hawaiiensis TaxID=134902 RepID=UPI0020198AAE|nr:placenta-specific gene 8 protein-like isoform X1 [Corvus hawaiiensis]XP_048161215.1 placenta-specific gene 8 protein-like isoform X1 [Corvus hawaiiensis]
MAGLPVCLLVLQWGALLVARAAVLQSPHYCLQRGEEKIEEDLGMAAPTVVTIQPQFGGAMSSVSRCMWQTSLMDCCTDCGVCCCGMFCFPCLACQVAGDMNECCLCGTSVAMRTMYRTRYNIPVSAEPACSPAASPKDKGSICSDFCVTLCCPVCSICQIKRDINRRRELGIF